MKIKDLVKGNTVKFVGIQFVNDNPTEVKYNELCTTHPQISFEEAFDGELRFSEGWSIPLGGDGFLRYEIDQNGFSFIVPFSDLKGGKFLSADRAIFFMRWIREENERKVHTGQPTEPVILTGYKDELETE